MRDVCHFFSRGVAGVNWTTQHDVGVGWNGSAQQDMTRGAKSLARHIHASKYLYISHMQSPPPDERNHDQHRAIYIKLLCVVVLRGCRSHHIQSVESILHHILHFDSVVVRRT